MAFVSLRSRLSCSALIVVVLLLVSVAIVAFADAVDDEKEQCVGRQADGETCAQIMREENAQEDNYEYEEDDEEDELLDEEDVDWSEDEDDGGEDEDDEEQEDEEEEVDAEFTLDLGVPQVYSPPDGDDDYHVSMDDFLEDYRASVSHLAAVARNPELRHVLPHCRNRHELCTYWAARGDCEIDSSRMHFMEMECCPACRSAPTLSWNMACPIPQDAQDAWQPGDLHRLFHNITRHPEYAQYQPQVHSRPHKDDEEYEAQDGDEDDTRPRPWVVTLENVVSPMEAERLIHHGSEHGWEESYVSGDEQEDGSSEMVVSDIRTSQLAWCTSEECIKDDVVQTVLHRMCDIVNMPYNHSDFLQLLKYDPGQYYQEHHDMHQFQAYSMSGARILTFYIYLSDVDEGGGTNFPYLNNLTIHPKLGRALLWPNVLDENPYIWDDRMFHQALPVIRGQKFGATAWFHQRDFKLADEQNCAQ